MGRADSHHSSTIDLTLAPPLRPLRPFGCAQGMLCVFVSYHPPPPADTHAVNMYNEAGWRAREYESAMEVEPLDAGAVTIREARVSDAAKCLEYLRTTSAEPGRMLPVDADEWDMPVQDEEAFIQHMAATPNCLMLVVEAQDEIVGILTCNGGTRRAMRHAVTLGVSLREDYRDRGLGHRLMQRTVDWARSNGVTRIELHVYVENARAIHLYEKFGFKIEGRRPHAYYHNGRYIDDLVMGLLLQPNAE